MTSILKVEALSGVQDDGPLCYLLQVDEQFILLDCGWDDRFDLAYIDAIKLRVPQISAVLISYPDIPHLGALPYLVKKCGLNCPIYATVPVYKMGQLFCYDWIAGHNQVEDFSLFNFDDIDAAFEKVQQVKYSQTILLKGDSGLQFTPFSAGHMIGGALWKITKMGEEEIVYAVDFNHKKERHLNGCTFDGIGRPNLLITDAFNADYSQQKRKQLDENLVSKLLSTVREGGDAMVVIDTGGRVLEIAQLLDQLWQNKEAGLMTYNLAMLSNVAQSVIDAAKSQVEWMSDKILKMFETGRHNPFQFRYMKLCNSIADLNGVRSPKVVLVSGSDMESGLSRELFLEWCHDTNNMVILTGRAGSRTLTSKLIRIAESRERKQPISSSLTLEVKRRIRLEGAELDAYRARKKEKEQEAARIRLETSRRNAQMEQDEDSMDESDDDDDVAVATVAAAVGKARASQGAVTSTSATFPGGSLDGARRESRAEDHPYDIMFRFELHQKSSFFKQSKKLFPMFPFQEDKSKWDDYGEIIRPEEYIIADAVVPQVEQQQQKALKRAIKVEERMEDVDDPDKATPLEEWPTKCISSKMKIEVLCKVEFIEFEGRSDGESIKKILAQIKPKQIVIVHGSAASTRNLAEHCRQHQIAQVFTPTLGEVVDATTESHIFQVTLSDQLMSSLIFQSVKDAELTWLDGVIKKKNVLPVDMQLSDAQHQEQGQATATAATEHEEPMDVSEVEDGPRQSRKSQVVVADQLFLDALPANSIPPHQSVFVNDPKLTDLKQLLTTNGFHAEFSIGVLYVNNVVSVKRNEAGRFHIEGHVCEDYFRIRDLIFKEIIIL